MDEDFVSLVAAAVRRLRQPGIESWGVDTPDPALLDRVQVGESFGCTTWNCAHVSHDPAAPVYRVIPTRGEIVRLGWDRGDGGAEEYFVLLVGGRAAVFLRLVEERGRWGTLRVIPVDQVPAYLLARLAEEPA